LSDFVQQQHTICNFSNEGSWVILSPIEQSIKQKIESVGTPLKDWDIKIYRGVLTGYNDAFIISTEKRDEILANCQTEDERLRTAELIRPILRGRDIKRYGYDWANLWIINTHNGIKGVKPRIDINEYPAVKAHLDQYWDKISKRADKGDTPYNLRNCAYLDDFFKPKIVWARLMRISKSEIDSFPRFSKADAGYFVVDSLCFFTGKNIDKLCAYLNSSLATYYYLKNIAILDNGGMQMRQQYIEDIPCPPIEYIENDRSIYNLFCFTKEEVDFIEKFIEMHKNEILNGNRAE
jgi:type IIS restriction enzyme R and M protein